MSHDHTHDTHAHATPDNAPKTSLNSSFWFVLILVGLFISAVNFVSMSSEGGHEEHGGGHSTEAHATEATHEHGHEATEGEAAGHETATDSAAEHPAKEGHAEEAHHEGH